MLEALLQGLGNLTPYVLMWMMVGVVVCTVIAIIPGLGGVFAMVLLLPLVYTLPPEAGLAMLVAAMAVAGTGNTITGVLFGVPGSATGVATILDGYPMAQKGEATRALTAGLTASAVGGIIGALILAAILPVMRPIVLSLGSPEFFMMIFAALVFMAYVGEGSMLKSLSSGFAGLMLSFVGLEISTATSRFTFGSLYLIDGIRLVALFIGLFAVAEMLVLLRKGGSIAAEKAESGAKAQVLQGLGDVFKHWRPTLSSSTTGVVVGLAPGLGAAAAQFIAYTQAMKLSKNGRNFGKGEVEGVIAADAATNSKDGGALVPTLAFGIPGSSSMALLLAAMIGMGIQPGQEMLTENLDLVWMFIFILVLANVAGAAICIAFSGLFARFTQVKASTLAPPILIISLFGAYATDRTLGDVWTAVLAGILGYGMVRFGYSRATFVIGFVLGILLERHYLLSMRLYGLDFLRRPVALGIAIAIMLVVLMPVITRLIRGLRSPAASENDAADDPQNASR
jgi:putative tricarboxylic transport membrane protein